MTRRRLGSLLGAAALAALLTSPAAAQTASPVKLRGQIASVESRTLTVQTRDGGVARLELTPEAKIVGMVPIRADAVAADATVGAAAIKQPGGAMKALLVVVYPGSIGGAGEGYFSWDLTPDSTMVQGEVKTNEAAPEGRIISVYYPQAGAKLIVAPDTPVVQVVPGDAALLQKGASIFVPDAQKGAGEALSTGLIAVGKDGFVPPM